MADNNKMKEQLQEITERLEQGIKEVFESEKYKEYLNTMSKFYNYSFNNTMLIAMQKPDATLVAGFNAWREKFDRHVLKGEKGIRIIAPAPIKRREEMEKIDPVTEEPVIDDNGKPVMEVVETTTRAFKVIPVFDVSQTDGKPLPELAVEELNGEVKDFDLFMEALTQVAPVPIGYEEIADGAKGYYHLEDKRIAIQEGMSQIQTVKTAIHETTHAKLHDIDLNRSENEIPQEQKKDRKTKEVEAESIAYTVCQHYGIDTSDYSFGYVAGWSSGKELNELRSSLETIRSTAAALIKEIDAKVAELETTKEQTKEPIRSTDVIVKITGSMGSEYEVDRVMGLNAGQVQSLLEEVPGMMDNGWDGNIAEYLVKNGAEVAPILSSNGLGNDYPTFFDFEFDMDINGVIPKTELSTISQAENLIHRMEYAKDLFSKEERSLIVNYAYQFANMETVDSIASDIATEGYGITHGGVSPERQASVDIDYDYLPDGEQNFTNLNEYGYTKNDVYPLGKEKALELYEKDLSIMLMYQDNSGDYATDREDIEAFEGIFGVECGEWHRFKEQQDRQSELSEEKSAELALEAPQNPLTEEEKLLDGKEDSFGIYQLKKGDELHYHRFEGLERLKKHGLSVEKENYELIYTAPLKAGQTLDDIFEEFNMFRPEDFKGHSLSVSDIVMIHKGGENHVQYVDSFGFTEIPDFLEQKQEITAEIPLKVENVDSVSLGDMVYLDTGKALHIVDDQTVNHASWRKDLKGLDASEGTIVKFNANQIEQIQFSDGKTAEHNSEKFIDHIYVIEDIQAKQYKLTKYEDYPSAREAYYKLPFDKTKALGVQNIRGGSLDLIQCKDGEDTAIMDCKKVEGWNNPSIYGLVEQISIDVVLHRQQELAFEFDDRYLMIHECDDGYDYTFYDKNYKEMDGGVYDNPDITMRDAMHIILTDDPFPQGERKIIDYQELDEKVETANNIVPSEQGMETPVSFLASERIPQESLNLMSKGEIQEIVLDYAQGKLDEIGAEVTIKEAKVYGSRSRGLEREGSDVDVVLSYSGDMREDAFFNLLHEDGLEIGGMPVDINPISEEKTGSIEDYLEQANKYLDEKDNTLEPKQTLTFYVAECSEFHSLGEFYDNLTLEEAVKVFESIPPERMNGIRGMGFNLHTEGQEPYMDSEFDILTGKVIDVDTINHIAEFRDNPLVQQAVKEVMEHFPNAEIWDRETKVKEAAQTAEVQQMETEKPEMDFDVPCKMLAVELDQFSQDYDLYTYRDNVENQEENINSITESLQSGDTDHIKEWLQEIIEDEEPKEDVARATELLSRIDDIAERREHNPLAKVEELEEANYNQIDGTLNNLKPKSEEQKEKMSIMEKLQVNKEKTAKQNQPEKVTKEVEKKKEISMD